MSRPSGQQTCNFCSFGRSVVTATFCKEPSGKQPLRPATLQVLAACADRHESAGTSRAREDRTRNAQETLVQLAKAARATRMLLCPVCCCGKRAGQHSQGHHKSILSGMGPAPGQQVDNKRLIRSTCCDCHRELTFLHHDRMLRPTGVASRAAVHLESRCCPLDMSLAEG